MTKERIPISGDLGSKVKQLMEYAGWYEGRSVDISIAEKYYAEHGVPMMKTTQRFYRKYFGLCCEWYLAQKKLNWAADFELPFYAEIQNESFSLNFEEEQEDEDSELEDEASCVYWEEATPILKQVAAVAYRTAKSELNVDTEAFEVSYNGPEDWYYPLEK